MFCFWNRNNDIKFSVYGNWLYIELYGNLFESVDLEFSFIEILFNNGLGDLYFYKIL